MSVEINIGDRGNSYKTTLDLLPSQCPYCHFTIAPYVRGGYFVNGFGSDAVDLVCKCTNSQCNQTFVAKYKRSVSGYNIQYSDTLYYSFNEIAHPTPKPTTIFPELLGNLSPNFVSIFNQSEVAEDANLDKITGIGYRKALEFLIKDYLISKNPTQDEQIKKTALGNCINEIADQRIKDLAKRAVWIGNDETHYIKKWRDKDVKDLKSLIRLVVHHVTADLEYIEALRTMPQS